MSINMFDLLKAEMIGVREYGANCKRILAKKKDVTVIMSNGKPKSVLVPYRMMVDILESLTREA